MTPVFDPGPNPHGVPKVLVGALGPKMVHMAAEVADGVLVMPFNSDLHMRTRTMPAIEAGLAAAGRTRSDIELTAEVIVSVGRDEEELAAAKGVRNLLAFYGSTPSYRPVLDVEGWGDLQPVLNAMSKRGEWAEMVDLVDDEMVSILAVRGTPSRVRGGDLQEVRVLRPHLRLLSRLPGVGRAGRRVRRCGEGAVMSSDDRVLVDVTDGVATLTLNDPAKRNAFTGRMGRELAEAYRRCDADEAVRVVVLTGTPPPFCAGADMSEGAATFRSRDESTFSAAGVSVPAWQLRKPVVAAVNGHAIGIGLTLTLQCDIRIFAADAKYGVVQVRRGVMGDGFSHWTLPRLVGMSAAAEILLTGRTFDGSDAKEIGPVPTGAPQRRGAAGGHGARP